MGKPAYTPEPEIQGASEPIPEALEIPPPIPELVIPHDLPNVGNIPFHERGNLSPRTRRIVFSYDPPLNEEELRQHYRHVRFFEFGEPPPRWNRPILAPEPALVQAPAPTEVE